MRAPCQEPSAEEKHTGTGLTRYRRSYPSAAAQPFLQLIHTLLPDSISENTPKHRPTATNIPWVCM